MEVEPKHRKTKKRSILRRLIWGMALLFGLLILRGYWIDSDVLLTSQSPNGEHTIEIINRGTEGFFGRSHVRIKYKNQHLDRDISNDGKNLRDAHASVEWTSKDTALITLTGEEQYPEIIEFDSKGSDVFKTIQVVLDANTLTTSVSTDHTKVVEIRHLTRSEGEKSAKFLRYYYGENGSTLDEYEEVDFFYSTDHYEFEWVNNDHVSISRVSQENELIETVEIDFN